MTKRQTPIEDDGHYSQRHGKWCAFLATIKSLGVLHSQCAKRYNLENPA